MSEKTKVLIVDDEARFADSLADILTEKGGYEVEIANSGAAALVKVKEKAYAVVLMDIKMPVMNGLETYLELKKVNPNINAIMMTAYRQEMDELVQSAIKNNAYACIYKPFSPEVALKLIDEIVKKKLAKKEG